MNPNLDTFQLNNKIYTNNNNILLEVINNLQQLINYSQDNLIIQILKNVIIKINFIIYENRKNAEQLRNDITNLLNQMNKRFDRLEFNINHNKEIEYDNGKYIGPLLNGLPHGKGVIYWNDGDKYEGDWINGKREGKGITYYGNGKFKGDRYVGDYKNNLKEGKGIYYYANGSRYEGDFNNNTSKGKGIYYYDNGDRYEE